MLEIKLGRLKHDMGFTMPLELQAACDPAAIGYADILPAAPLEFYGRAENVLGEIHVSGRLTAELTLVCSRCGQPFPYRLTVPFAEVYSSQEVGPDSEGEQDKHQFSGDIIDITPEALRLLFEQLPMKPLCREDCRGLCLNCGADLNREACSCVRESIDPRWEKLRDLLQAHDD